MRNRVYQNQKGFTLIDMLVAITIFTLIFLIVVDIFLISQRVERKILIEQKVLADGRLALEKIAQQIRLKNIDYSDSWPTEIENSELRLVDELDNKIYFRQGSVTNPDSDCPAGVSNCLEMSLNQGASWQALTSNNVEIENLNFYIYPIEDPFQIQAGGYLANQQPRVTINLTLSSDLPEFTSDLILQTTVSSRVYKR